MKFKISLVICILASLFTSVSVFAQHGAVGGGLLSEAEMQVYINRLDAFLLTEEGQNAFPEIAIHDRFSTQSFHQIAQATYPVMSPDVQYDQFGNPRTCVSYQDQNHLYFKCHQAEFDTSVDFQPRDYEIILHELFVQAGIERPVSPVIPSHYKISSRILDHLFKDDSLGWLPGSLPQNPITQTGIWCTDQPSIQSNEVSTQSQLKVLFWETNGNVHLVGLKQGNLSDLFYGFSPMPKNLQQSTQAVDSSLPVRSYQYAPLQTSIDSSSGLWLVTNENILFRSSTTTLESGSKFWTEILGNIILRTNGILEQHLVACQSMDSWKESALYDFINPLLKTKPTPYGEK